MNMLQKLRQLHTEITTKDPLQALKAWELVERLIARVPVDPVRAAEVVRAKDAAGFDALLTSLEQPTSEAPAEAHSFGYDDLQAALRAFRKRLKVVRLNDESRLGGRYTSGGRTSAIDAVQPPSGFDPKIWSALVQEGKLKPAGQGLYALAEGADG